MDKRGLLGVSIKLARLFYAVPYIAMRPAVILVGIAVVIVVLVILLIYMNGATATVAPSGAVSLSGGSVNATLPGNAPSPAAATYTYVGCFTDNALARQLPNNLSDTDSIAQCQAAAKAAGYKYFGMQAGKSGSDQAQCWGGNSTTPLPGTYLPQTASGTTLPILTAFTAYPSATCAIKDSSGNYIGGPWQNAVYQV